MHHFVIDREAERQENVGLYGWPTFSPFRSQLIIYLLFLCVLLVPHSLTFVVLPVSFLLFWSSDGVSEPRGRLSSLDDLSQMMVFAAEPWHYTHTHTHTRIKNVDRTEQVQPVCQHLRWWAEQTKFKTGGGSEFLGGEITSFFNPSNNHRGK